MLILIVGLALFVTAVFFAAPAVRGSLQGPALVLVGLLLALVPAAIWLIVFYAQDRVEPEPKQYVAGVFFLGLLLAAAIGQPLIQGFFHVNEWASASLGLRLLAGICIIGITQEFLKYAAVRYSVFRSAEFDERIDGIIYGAAAGLGYATFLNVEYVIANGGVDLAIGAVRIAVVALAQASFAGVSGYFLGRAKFENRGPFWLPVGLLLAAVLNGVVTTLLSEITRSGLRPTPLNGLVLAAVVAAATFIILFGVLRRGARPAPVPGGANS
jgi:RsiW-degrading membrane proteinase PrsW (M82 family)